MKKINCFFLLLLLVNIALATEKIEIIPRYNYFLSSQMGEMKIIIPEGLSIENYKLFCDDNVIQEGKISPSGTIVNFDLDQISESEKTLKIKFDKNV